MKLLSAVVVLLFSLAYAQQKSEQQLRHPEFLAGKTHYYDVTINMTSGVSGLSSQVAKSAIQAELKIYAKTSKDLIIQLERVEVSGSQPGVGSPTDQMNLREDSSLEQELEHPSSATYEDGKITSYSFSSTDSLQARKIRKTILRNLEMHLDEKALKSQSEKAWPITYNVSKTSAAGSYDSRYIVTSSPYYEFPEQKSVYNISRVDDFEGIPYLAYKTHHNFEKQGCSEVCQKDKDNDQYGAGCPSGHEPHHSPIKRSFVQQHNLRAIGSSLIIESIKTKETHLADVYDQTMDVTVQTEMKFIKAIREQIANPSEQQIQSNSLHDLKYDIDEKEIEQLCEYPESSSAINEVKSLLDEIAEAVLKNEIQEEKSKRIGEILVTLQKLMHRLEQGHFRTIQRSIVSYDEMKQASEKDKIKRQIWLDLLPVVGTHESVSFIVQHITEYMNVRKQGISFWESKSILDALPENIHRPSDKTIIELNKLLEILKNQELKTPGHTMFYASAHMAVAKVIRSLCSEIQTVPDNSQSNEQTSRLWRSWIPQGANGLLQDEFKQNYEQKCPEILARGFLDVVTRDLMITTSKAKRMIYIEALSRTGLESAIDTLKHYIYSHSDDAIFRGHSANYVDYLRTSAIYSLHNIVQKSPKAVQDALVPVFFNVTEAPKLRTAAFSILVQSQPSLSLLQHIAAHSWQEPSEEVASYVTSALEAYGNSSLPCNQMTSQRIKKIIPQLKRAEFGPHKAKNVMFDLWDDVRRFGLEHHHEYTPSNESIIPNTFYSSFGYHMDSFKDNYFQHALHAQGFSAHKIYDSLMKQFGLSPAESIPKSSERKIFPDLKIASRDSEPWRISAYQKLFYDSAYYYFDAEDNSNGDLISMWNELLNHYITTDSQGQFSGHFVKVYIPSHFHTKTVSQAFPYPMQFQMRSPLLISLKFQTEKISHSQRGSSGIGYKIHLTPSIYHSIIYNHEILNLGDCKRIGVYHEHKTAASYPITVSFQIQRHGRFAFGYKFTEMPKHVFSHSSEAGTYAGKDHMEPIPSDQDRRTIKTRPAQFVKSLSWDVFGLPSFEGEIKTEDIQYGQDPTPRSMEEAARFFSKHVLNAGWRRKSVQIARAQNSRTWRSDSEVELKGQYSRQYNTKANSESETKWSSDFKFDDKLDQQDASFFASESQKIEKKFQRTLNNIEDSIQIEVEHKSRSSVQKKGELNLVYTRTHFGYLHQIHFNASRSMDSKQMKVCGDLKLGFIQAPNEFKYNEKYGQQKGVAWGSISTDRSDPFSHPFMRAAASFEYKPLKEVLQMDSQVDDKEFEPETHEECEQDQRKGNLQSTACIKAIREKSIYNHLKMSAALYQEAPEFLKALGEKIDSYLKQAFFSHMQLSKKSEEEKKDRHIFDDSIKEAHLELTYIDKMTDEPVLDIVLEKPSEYLNFSKISLGKLRPISSIDSIAETYAAAWTNNTYPATCSLTGNFVRTFDMKNYQMPRYTPACSYVLSTHCTENKKFAVLVKHDPKSSNAQEIRIHAGRDEIVLTPFSRRSSWKLKYNGQDQSIQEDSALMLNEEALLTAFVKSTDDGSKLFDIHARKAGFRVRYDGSNVKIQVSPKYKGELCGLCSEFDGESTREYRGVDRCLYQTGEDFAKSSIVGRCTDKTPRFKAMCDYDSSIMWGVKRDDSSEENSNEDGSEPTTKRNIVSQRRNEICFSTKPVPVCENGAEPQSTESRQVNFHCLPKQDVHARKMVTESKRRILGELETKAVDFSESVQVAKTC